MKHVVIKLFPTWFIHAIMFYFNTALSTTDQGSQLLLFQTQVQFCMTSSTPCQQHISLKHFHFHVEENAELNDHSVEPVVSK